MTTPTEDFERRLRASLDRHAREAPPGGPLAERILLEIEAPVLRPKHGWRVWIAPLVAAAAIVAAALALVGIGNDHPGAAPAPALTQPVSPTPIRDHRGPTSHPTRPTRTTPPPRTVTSSVPIASTGGVRGFRAADISFDNATEGWALGSASCVHGPGRCTEILHTTDGTDWSAAPTGETFNVPGVRKCADPCVTNLRFANSTVGYAFGANALFMTTDGGAHWTRQPGLGADVLETVDGNVILVRVSSGPALFRRAGVGSATWTPFTVPGFPATPVAGSVQLSRAYGVTVLAVDGYRPTTATGSPGAVFRSTDGGASWTRLARPCGIQSIGYHNAIAGAVVSAGDGSMVVDCAVQTSADPIGFGSTVSAAQGSTRFDKPVSGGKVVPAELLAAPTRGVQLVVTGAGDLYRSTDTGNSWTRLAQPSGVTYLGFHSGTDGRAVSDGGRALWTTTDAGATWSEVVFPR